MEKRTTRTPDLRARVCAVIAMSAVGFAACRDSSPQPVAAPAAAPVQKNLAYRAKDEPGLAVGDVPANRFQIIDVHEHVRDEHEGVRLLAVMDALGIARSCLLCASWYTFTLDPRFGF